MPLTISSTLQETNLRTSFQYKSLRATITPGTVDAVCFEVARVRVCDDGPGAVVDRGGVGAGCSDDFGVTDASFVEARCRQNGGGKEQNPP